MKLGKLMEVLAAVTSVAVKHQQTALELAQLQKQYGDDIPDHVVEQALSDLDQNVDDWKDLMP